MVIVGKKILYSGNSWLGKSGSIPATRLYSDKSGCIRAKWFYSGKVVVVGKKLLYSGNSCYIPAKWLYFAKLEPLLPEY